MCSKTVQPPPACKLKRKTTEDDNDILVEDSQPRYLPRKLLSPRSHIFSAPNPQQRHKYTLHCIVLHRGERAQGGHYVAYVNDKKAHSWKCFDDSNVEKVLFLKLINIDFVLDILV